jgi:hypothetical protein
MRLLSQLITFIALCLAIGLVVYGVQTALLGDDKSQAVNWQSEPSGFQPIVYGSANHPQGAAETPQNSSDPQ